MICRKWWLLSFGLTALLVTGCGNNDADDNVKIDKTRHDAAWILKIALSGSLQNAAFSPSSDEIVFTRFVSGYNEDPADIYVLRGLDEGTVKQLVSDGSTNVNLPGSAWNKNEEAIVFSSSRDPHDEIYMIDDGAEPGDEKIITSRSNFMAYEPTFSPNGNWVVFESHPLDIENEGVITKYEIDGSDEYVALTDPSDDCRQPNWSPAGDKILYQRFDGSQWDLWVMNTDGTGQQQITSGPGDKTDASFSPDGDWIVYSSDEGELDLANIFIIPTVGGNSTRVTNWAGYDGAPSWSPDGKLIAFESYPGDPDNSPGTKLWIINAPQFL